MADSGIITYATEVMLTVAVSTDGSFFAVVQRMTESGEPMQAVEHGETRQELFEWLDRQMQRPTMQ